MRCAPRHPMEWRAQLPPAVAFFIACGITQVVAHHGDIFAIRPLVSARLRAESARRVALSLRALFRSKKWLGARGLKASATAADRRDFIRAISFVYTSQPKIEAEP